MISMLSYKYYIENHGVLESVAHEMPANIY